MSEQPSFEETLRTLEQAVEKLEQGQMPLDEALAWFETGVRSAGLCRKLLQDVEGRVEVLLKQPDGTSRISEFAEDASVQDDD